MLSVPFYTESKLGKERYLTLITLCPISIFSSPIFWDRMVFWGQKNTHRSLACLETVLMMPIYDYLDWQCLDCCQMKFSLQFNVFCILWTVNITYWSSVVVVVRGRTCPGWCYVWNSHTLEMIRISTRTDCATLLSVCTTSSLYIIHDVIISKKSRFVYF